MNLTVLGSNAGSPAPGNPGSGYLVQSGETSVWMDCGPGTFAELVRHIEPVTLDAVVVSHRHLDHSTDLLGLFAYIAYGLRVTPGLSVYAADGVHDAMTAYLDAGDDHLIHQVFDVQTVEPGDTRHVGELALTFGQAVHPVPSLVTRIDSAGSRITYSGDTGPGGDLIELATGADLLLCEASMQGVRDPSTYPYHLTAREAGEIAAIAGASVLAVTHIPFTSDPQLTIDQASSAFVGTIEHASPGRTFMTE